MGQIQQTINSFTTQQSDKSHSPSSPTTTSFLKTYHHNTLGTVKINDQLNNPYKCVTMKLTRHILDQSVVKEWQKAIDQIVTRINPNNVNVNINVNVDKDNGQNDVKNVINSTPDQYKDYNIMLPVKHNFESIGFCSSHGILHQVRLCVGNIHPMNILINEQGHTKLLSRISIPQQVTEFKFAGHLALDRQKGQYKAPEQISCIRVRNNHVQQQCLNVNNNDYRKSDIFCLGMTVLAAAILQEDLNSLVYKVNTTMTTNSKGETIEQHSMILSRYKLELALKSLKQHYSSFLYEIVQEMLKENPLQRKTAGKILKDLSKYKQNICNLQPFLPVIGTSMMKKSSTSYLSSPLRYVSKSGETQSPPGSRNIYNNVNKNIYNNDNDNNNNNYRSNQPYKNNNNLSIIQRKDIIKSTTSSPPNNNTTPTPTPTTTNYLNNPYNKYDKTKYIQYDINMIESLSNIKYNNPKKQVDEFYKRFDLR